MPALSTVEARSEGSVSGAGYGLLERGADWSEARGVLIAMHGRELEAALLPAQLAEIAARHRCRILAPIAPGLSWYPGRHDAGQGNEAGREAALAEIDRLMALANRQGFADRRIVLVGFSQGGCVVTEYLLWGSRRPGGAAIFTGCSLTVPAEPSGRCAGVSVVITSGENDPWLPLDDLFVAADALERAGARVTREIFSGQDHVVRPREMELLDELIEHLLAQEK